MLEHRIQQHFIDSADLRYQAAQTLSKPIAAAVQAILACVTSGGKVLACGNGGSAADAQHFSDEFVGRFERERPELGAIALTTDSSILTAIDNDYDYNVIFSKQVRAHARVQRARQAPVRRQCGNWMELGNRRGIAQGLGEA